MKIKDNVVRVVSALDAAWLAHHIGCRESQQPNQKLVDALARYKTELEKPTHE